MPAIDLLRLRQQVARLSEFFFLPEEFVKHLRALLEMYHNPTLRPTQASTPLSLFSYRTPPMVLRAIEQELRELAVSYPEYALELADALWKEEVLETRLLAAFLLGQIPPREEWLLARLMAWSNQVRDAQLRTMLLENGLERMRRETPQLFLSLIAEWLNPQRPQLWENALQALIPLLEDKDFENFPPIFNLLRPVLEHASPMIQNEIAAVLEHLLRRVPHETVFTFRQWLVEAGPQSGLWRTLRRLLPLLSPAAQQLIGPLVRR